MDASALKHLLTVDPILGEVITKVGDCGLEADHSRSPFEALVQAVAHQQLNGKAAATILGRFRAIFAPSKFPTPQQLYDVPVEALTGAGFSRAKASYIKEIARMTLDGVVPTRRQIRTLTDEEIITRLTQIKGVGRWTVEMLLIFSLGRPDVLPVDDFGIRTGFGIAFRKRRLPSPEQVRRHGERWKPYRSTASWVPMAGGGPERRIGVLIDSGALSDNQCDRNSPRRPTFCQPGQSSK